MNKLSQWWDKISLSTKLAVVLLPSVVIGTIALMIILNSTSLHASFLNKDNDVTGWGSLLIGSAIGIYITFAILIYSDDSQKKISDIIIKQNERDEKRKKFVIQRLRLENSFLEIWAESIAGTSSDYRHMASDKSGTDNTQKEIEINAVFEMYDKQRDVMLHNLENILGFSGDILESKIISDVDKILQKIRTPIIIGKPPSNCYGVTI